LLTINIISCGKRANFKHSISNTLTQFAFFFRKSKKKRYYTIQQKTNDRYLDAWIDNDRTEQYPRPRGPDFAVVTRDAQNNASQRWKIAVENPTGEESCLQCYTLVQEQLGRTLDAVPSFYVETLAATTRVRNPSWHQQYEQNNDSQLWELVAVGKLSLQNVIDC
jgi:hypothetical protein